MVGMLEIPVFCVVHLSFEKRPCKNWNQNCFLRKRVYNLSRPLFLWMAHAVTQFLGAYKRFATCKNANMGRKAEIIRNVLRRKAPPSLK